MILLWGISDQFKGFYPLIINRTWFSHRCNLMKKLKIIVLPIVLIIISCSEKNIYNYIILPENNQDSDKRDEDIKVNVLKWKDDHTAAVSITYDGGWLTGGSMPNMQISQDMVLERGLVLDYEIVTATYEPYPTVQAELRENQLPLGIHFFGHGHYHDAHDQLDFIECLNSFRKCFRCMYEWGLNPKAYAYPHGSGRTPSTQLACKIAGFICARGFDPPSEDMYICPDDEMEPQNWYLLPCIPISSVDNPPEFLISHSEIAEALEITLTKTAWVILTYHSIGFVGNYGYYPFEYFGQDLDTIVENDFWCSNMDVIACYIKERSRFKFEMEKLNITDENNEYNVVFRDGLDNSIYDTPLTVDFTFADSLTVQEIKFEPALNGLNEYEVINNKLRINVIPDDKRYKMTIIL